MKVKFYCGRENGPLRPVREDWAEHGECSAGGVVEIDPEAYGYDGEIPLAEWVDEAFSMPCPRCRDDIEPGFGCFEQASDDAVVTHALDGEVTGGV